MKTLRFPLLALCLGFSIAFGGTAFADTQRPPTQPKVKPEHLMPPPEFDAQVKKNPVEPVLTPAEVKTLKPGQGFRDCPECPEVMIVPPGIFIMGTNQGAKQEGPAVPVRVRAPFAIGKYETTFDQWAACVKDLGCAVEPDDHRWGKGRRPVMNVDWETAQQYTKWLTRKTGQTYRLPSEAEWEYAAKGGKTTEYPWGNDVGQNKANCRQCGTPWSGKGTAPVGAFEPNPFGLYDMNGNVWEWTLDCWNENHEGRPKDTAPRLEGDCALRAMRSGSWYYFSRLSRSVYRFKNRADVKSYNIGFRVVRELK